MAQSILFLQSMWAMERRHTDGFERSVEDNVKMILDAGFDGASLGLSEPNAVERAAALLKGKAIEGVCYPTSVEGLKPVLELATRIGVTHLNVQPNVRPRTIAECAPFLEGWLKLGEQAKFPLYFETHRDRMTTDLFFTLDLLDRYPDLPLLGDLSHFLVGREFAMPIDEQNHAYMQAHHRQLLGVSWPRRQPRAGADRDQLSPSQGVGRYVLELVELRLHVLAAAREGGRGAALHLRTGPAALCDHGARRQRHDGSLARGFAAARPCARGLAGGLVLALLRVHPQERRVMAGQAGRADRSRSRCASCSSAASRGTPCTW